MRHHPPRLLFLFAFFSASAFAGYEGEISFTPGEIAWHESNQPLLLETASACLKKHFERHTAFFKQHGVSPYYGEGSDFAKKSERAQRRELRRKGADEDLLEQMEATSCIGMTMKCLAQGFEKAGQADLWLRLKKFTVANGVGGMPLQHGLQKLGWKLLFWNPDLRRNRVRAIYEAKQDPGNKRRYWGFHEEYWQSVSTHGTYLYNRVDDFRLLLNFGPQVPPALKPIPFFVGTAHGGYHVFSGTRGQVIEAHSLVDIDDPKTIDSSPFNPMEGQGPGEGMYFSGLIAVPAQYAR